MEKIISDKISYIEASDDPLSADIGIVRENGTTWLFDVGNGEASQNRIPQEPVNVVLSHFHADHIGNIGKVRADKVFASKETLAHCFFDTKGNDGVIVNSELCFGKIRIIPIPSSHAPGSVCLEVDGHYAFVGDALYCKTKGEKCVYNTQLLNAEIEVLEKMSAEYLLVSHFEGLVRKKEAVIAELKEIYSKRDKNSAFIETDD